MAPDDTPPPTVVAGLEPPAEPTAAGAPVPPGDRVERTGIALVHEGEYIVPAPGSEALLSPAAGAGPVVNYYFPVEVELVGDLDDALVQRVVAGVFAELDRELSSRQ
ncbi:hypothetical protein [Streptomyces sp. NPDC001978]|uniref:hypothetical protein n=1 Tax=Streptomyces sp. NPDC001978 TaxID=3364627 RepID=UPI0036D0AA5B